MAAPDKPRSQPRLERLTVSPELFLKDFNPERDVAVLSPMSEASDRESVFMINVWFAVKRGTWP